MHGYVFTMQYPCGWVSPFGHCRIKACCQLPDTFRRLPRPSSPLTAKASTVYAWSLDHITPSRLGAYSDSSTGTRFRQTTRSLICLNDTSRFGFEPKRLSLVYVFKEHHAGLNAGWLQINLCVRVDLHIRSGRTRELVEPVGIEPTTPCLQSRCSPS